MSHVKFCVPVVIRRSRIDFPVLHWNIVIYTYAQVRLVMLPSKRQKHKTKVRQGNSPQYMESFLLHRVNPGKASRQRNGWTSTEVTPHFRNVCKRDQTETNARSYSIMLCLLSE